MASAATVSASPDDAKTWSERGLIHVRAGDLEHAARCFRHAVTVDSRHADSWHNLGTALRKLGQPDAAFTALKNALLLDATRADTYLNLGNLLVEQQQLDDALKCFERAAQCDPTLARARSRLGAQLSAKGKTREAEDLFRQAVGLDARHVDGWLGLGRTLEDIGDADGALSCYRNVLARHAGHPAALGYYLSLLQAEAPDALLRAARAACNDATLTHEGKALIGYGLAKYHDKRKEPAAAAAAGRLANNARRDASRGLDRNSLQARVDALCTHYDADFFAKRRDCGIATGQPVFIVGLPRSGTTLTEQIIAAHPLLHGAGELPELARLAAQAAPAQQWRAAATLDVTGSRQLAHEYLRVLRDGAPRERLRISDKSPFNFFQLAFAALLFPQARVIHCRRNARDNALSIWMENFNPDQHYATDFGAIAFLHQCYEQVMAHWHNVLPLQILDVDYEDTVTDTEAQARRLIDFLGVPWDARCLDFHASKRAVQTPSRWQVREKVYSRSVAKWRAYAPFLPELLAAFPHAELP